MTNFHWKRYEITKQKREWTSRRLAAAKRAVSKEVEKTPLFPELARFSNVEERVRQQDEREDAWVKSMRSHRAKLWKEVRKMLSLLSLSDRDLLLDKWNTKFMPGGPAELFACAQMMERKGLIELPNPERYKS